MRKYIMHIHKGVKQIHRLRVIRGALSGHLVTAVRFHKTLLKLLVKLRLPGFVLLLLDHIVVQSLPLCFLKHHIMYRRKEFLLLLFRCFELFFHIGSSLNLPQILLALPEIILKGCRFI